MLGKTLDLAVAGTLIAVMAAIGWLAWLSLPQKNQYQQNSQAQQAASADPNEKPAIPIPLQIESNKSEWQQPECAKPKNREEADLCEQRRMAKAAKDTVALNRIQTVIGTIGAVLL